MENNSKDPLNSPGSPSSEKDSEIKVNVGGNVESALKGQYSLNIALILQEAWKLTQQSRRSINSGLIFVFLFGIFATLIISSFMGGVEAVVATPELFTFLNIIVTIVVAPIFAGIEMMGLLHCIGVNTRTNIIVLFLRKANGVILSALITVLVINLAGSIFTPIALYLLMVFSLTTLLVVEKDMAPIKAIVTTLQATRFLWYKILVIYTFLLFILMMLFVPLVVLQASNYSFLGVVFIFFGLAYLAPMYYHTKGIIYREIFGVTTTKTNDNQHRVNNTFDA